MDEWIDINGLIKPHKAWEDSGNGMLYTVIYNLTCRNVISVSGLYKGGLLRRTPDNSFGQDSHDNYLAFGVWLLYIGANRSAVWIIWTSIKKFGFMQNSFEKGDIWKSWIWRFPNVWLVMFAAAFPNVIVTWCCRQALQLLVSLSPEKKSDASGMQLKWLCLYTIKMMGNPEPLTRFNRKYDMAEIMNGYYDSDHPILEGFKNARLQSNPI